MWSSSRHPPCQAEDVDREYPANSRGTVIGWGYTAILRYEASGVGVVDSRCSTHDAG